MGVAPGRTGRFMPNLQPYRALQRRPLPIWQFLGLGMLLILPVLAIDHLSSVVDWRITSGAVGVFSLLAYLAIASDKRKALRDLWRTPESTLHFLELIGGWPGSFIAQRRFRHKISKGRYQFVFWTIVILYQLAAFDCLQNWDFFNRLLNAAK